MKLTEEEISNINLLQKKVTGDEPSRPLEKEPLLTEGDLSSVFSSKSGLLNELLAPELFIVSKGDQSRIYDDDLRFVDGVKSYFIYNQPNLPETFFVANVGHAHLPGVATVLIERKVEPFFYLPDAHPRIKETLKYWSVEYNALKDGLTIPPLSFAIMLDRHRKEGIGVQRQAYDVGRDVFPSLEFLRNHKIKNIVVFGEFRLGKNDTVQYRGGLDEFLNESRQNKISVLHYGIDMRQKIDLRRSETTDKKLKKM